MSIEEGTAIAAAPDDHLPPPEWPEVPRVFCRWLAPPLLSQLVWGRECGATISSYAAFARPPLYVYFTSGEQVLDSRADPGTDGCASLLCRSVHASLTCPRTRRVLFIHRSATQRRNGSSTAQTPGQRSPPGICRRVPADPGRRAGDGARATPPELAWEAQSPSERRASPRRRR